ncbi:hypothetical protein [Pseudovibrio exalbescens]|uniref:Formylmethanofuran dehydrogenase subunit E domain-containing protein n=1 Tax=Pseudovibrio exalbescens TaxID=197461 RepID=A0A1U7JGU3_9HYPH|nr:hypothetical protein [Pseudovibrio exalbescens]OKL43861.1 hypothetical protein A3843_11355 [Pseudovibrio exalbescens]
MTCRYYDDHSIKLKEGDLPLSFSRNDLIAYAGPDEIIATALMFNMFRFAFSKLARDGELLERNRVKVQLGFPGPGVKDCVELVLRGLTRNAANVTEVTENLPEEAPLALVGRFYYEFEYEDRRIGLWPKEGFFTDEFREMVITFQPRKGSDEEQRKFQEFKDDLIRRIMSAGEDNLFNWKEVPVAD